MLLLSLTPKSLKPFNLPVYHPKFVFVGVEVGVGIEGCRQIVCGLSGIGGIIEVGGDLRRLIGWVVL